MQKPRMSKQCVNGIVYWRCMGYPTLNGEAITGTGETPREAWRDYCHRFYEYALAERRKPPLVHRLRKLITR